MQLSYTLSQSAFTRAPINPATPHSITTPIEESINRISQNVIPLPSISASSTSSMTAVRIESESLKSKGLKAHPPKKTTNHARNIRIVWSSEEIETLQTLYQENVPVYKIAERLGRTRNACSCQLRRIKNSHEEAALALFMLESSFQ
jgi:hypothetical protein